MFRSDVVSPNKVVASMNVLRREKQMWFDAISSMTSFPSVTSCVEIAMLSKTHADKNKMPSKMSCGRFLLTITDAQKCLLLRPCCDILRLVVGGGSFCDSNAREQNVERECSALFGLNI
jgi:hypothetical protein